MLAVLEQASQDQAVLTSMDGDRKKAGTLLHPLSCRACQQSSLALTGHLCSAATLQTQQQQACSGSSC